MAGAARNRMKNQDLQKQTCFYIYKVTDLIEMNSRFCFLLLNEATSGSDQTLQNSTELTWQLAGIHSGRLSC